MGGRREETIWRKEKKEEYRKGKRKTKRRERRDSCGKEGGKIWRNERG